MWLKLPDGLWREYVCYDLAFASMVYTIACVEKAGSSYNECLIEVT
jgi:hypothetical protein